MLSTRIAPPWLPAVLLKKRLAVTVTGLLLWMAPPRLLARLLANAALSMRKAPPVNEKRTPPPLNGLRLALPPRTASPSSVRRDGGRRCDDAQRVLAVVGEAHIVAHASPVRVVRGACGLKGGRCAGLLSVPTKPPRMLMLRADANETSRLYEGR